MGFYGNITNTSKTQFQFDKIYSSRYDMETQARTDGIYAGRYVLVEYDTDLSQDSFYRVFINDNNGQMYNAPDVTAENNKITIGESLEFSDPNKGAVSVVPVEAFVFTADGDDTTRKYTNIVYYKVTGDLYKQNKDNNQLIKGNYKQVTADKTISPDGLESTVSNYTKNYAIDNEKYGAGRGYDSTVWQKAYIDNVEKYIMIAELNSVVPTFGVSADAPTAEPIAPHFDTQSTDLYYKLHWQPAWGMRIAEGKLPDAEKPGEITTSKDPDHGNYPSDEDVSYSKLKYNSATKEIEEDEQQPKVNYKGAIYYNKAGFEDYKHTYYNGSFKDKISVQPLGISGMKYNEHGNSIKVSAQPDIQEISIMLPSLGNALCDIWDKVYGYNPKNDNKRYRDIEWKDANPKKQEDGTLVYEKFTGKVVPSKDENYQGNTDLGDMTRSPETIAGCINMAHDLMGMIITAKDLPNTIKSTDSKELEDQRTSLKEEYKKHYIYFNNNKYWRLYEYSEYEIINITWDPTSLEGLSDQEINTKYELAVKAALDGYKGRDVYQVITEYENNSKEWIVKKYNKKVINGTPLAVKNGKYWYELVEIEGFADNLSTINGLVVSLKNLIESDNPKTRNRTTIQGTINVLNDIINCFEDLTPGEFLICDSNGKVNSVNWTTKETYYYKNYGKKTSDAEGKKTNENQWIFLSVDEKVQEDDGTIGKIALNHQAHSVKDTTSDSNKNRSSFDGQATTSGGTVTNNIDGINNDNNIDTLKLYTPIVDNTGHIVGRNTETVTLPFGYKYLETNGISDNGKSDLHTTFNKDTGEESKPTEISKDTVSTANANTTQDKITINTGNKWIQTKIEKATSNDTITIAHEVHLVDKQPIGGETNLNELKDKEIEAGQNPNKIKIQDMSFDAAGHITANKAHTYVLPYGFKKITSSSTPNVTEDAISNTATIFANNTQDTLIIAPSNKWIKTFVADKTLSLGHMVDQIKVTEKTETNLNDKVNDANGQATIIQNTFTVNDITNDEAGHIIANQPHTYRLPYGYKTIKTSNDTSSSTIQVPDSLTAIDQVASDTQDTITIKGADSWIKAKGENKIINIYHNSPNSKNNTPTTSANTDITKKSIEENGVTTIIEENTPNFGSTFDIPQISYDEAGHISSSTKYSIKLPAPTIITSKNLDQTEESGNVLIDLSLNSTTGVFTKRPAYVGTLKLNNYSQGKDKDAITSGDTINTAFSKLQAHIESTDSNISKEITNREKAISSEATARDAAIKAAIDIEVAARDAAISTASDAIKGTTEDDANKFTMQGLLRRIEALEERINNLENTNNPTV